METTDDTWRMNQRQTRWFGRGSVVWLVGILMFGGVGRLLPLMGYSVPTASAQERPNIVLIMADDLGYETVGAYGGKSYRTPTLDRLAATGMRFEHAYAQPLCTPSRVQLMTGKYSFRNYTQFGQLAQGERTFAHVLQDAGYHTLVAGKWQLNSDGGQTPTEAGFDEYMIRHGGSPYWGPTFETNGERQTYDPAFFGPDLLSDYINSFIERHRDEPFFVYYPMVLPHRPYVTTPDAPGVVTDTERLIAMVAYADKMVAKLIRTLGELGLRRKTLVLFTGDNGSSPIVNAEVETPTGTIFVRGQKGLPTDAGTRVPLIANWPGTIPMGVVNRNIVDFSVMLPTLAEVGTARVPSGLDGYSLFRELRGRRGQPRGWIYMFYDPVQSEGDPSNSHASEFARDVRYKLYRVRHCERVDQLFDLMHDRLEQHPIAPGAGDQEQEAARARLQGIFTQVRPGEQALPASCNLR